MWINGNPDNDQVSANMLIVPLYIAWKLISMSYKS